MQAMPDKESALQAEELLLTTASISRQSGQQARGAQPIVAGQARGETCPSTEPKPLSAVDRQGGDLLKWRAEQGNDPKVHPQHCHYVLSADR